MRIQPQLSQLQQSIAPSTELKTGGRKVTQIRMSWPVSKFAGHLQEMGAFRDPRIRSEEPLRVQNPLLAMAPRLTAGWRSHTQDPRLVAWAREGSFSFPKLCQPGTLEGGKSEKLQQGSRELWALVLELLRPFLVPVCVAGRQLDRWDATGVLEFQLIHCLLCPGCCWQGLWSLHS